MVYAALSKRPDTRRTPWNKGKLVGAKPPLKPSPVLAIRTAGSEERKRELALFSLAIESKIRGRDVVAARVDDVAPSGCARDRATIRQKKTGRPVRFGLTFPRDKRLTSNLRAVELLVGHSKIESNVFYMGIEVDDAIEIAEKVDI